MATSRVKLLMKHARFCTKCVNLYSLIIQLSSSLSVVAACAIYVSSFQRSRIKHRQQARQIYKPKTCSSGLHSGLADLFFSARHLLATMLKHTQLM